MSKSAFLLQTAGGAVLPRVDVWIALKSNNTGTTYKSAARTTTDGLYFHPAPGDTYTVYYSLPGLSVAPASTPPSVDWFATGDTAFSVPYVAGDEIAAKDVTTQLIGPYGPNLPGALANGLTVATPAGTQAGKFYDYGGMAYNVKAFGAKGDGVTDDSAFIGSGLTTNPGNTAGVWDWPAGNYNTTTQLTISVNNVRWRGVNWSVEASPYPLSRVSSQASALTILIKINTGLGGVSIHDMAFSGNPTNSPNCVAIDGLTGGTLLDADLQRLFFDQFGSSAVNIQAAVGLNLAYLFAQNCLLGGPTVDTGVFDLTATDVKAYNCFASASILGAAGIGNGHRFGWILRNTCTNGVFNACFGDQSHHGWLIANGANWNRFIGCRSYQPQGNGFKVQGFGNRFVACDALDASWTADNTWDGFLISGTGNTFAHCLVDSETGSARLPVHAFQDTGGGALDWQGNEYDCNRIGAAGIHGQLYYMNGATGYRITHPHRISADQGDANLTWNPYVTPDTIMYQTALTAGRTVSLANNGSSLTPRGTRVRVCRTAAATGASTLTVKGDTGGDTKVLAVSQWVDFEFDNASQWREVAFGSL